MGELASLLMSDTTPEIVKLLEGVVNGGFGLSVSTGNPEASLITMGPEAPIADVETPELKSNECDLAS